MFVPITEAEFWDVMKRAKRAPEVIQLNDVNRQLVVGWRVSHQGQTTDLMVKVYTSIFGLPGQGRSKPLGKDSMRVCLVDVRRGEGAGRATYTQRTRGWQDRLIEKIREMFEKAAEQLAMGEPPCCPVCNAVMHLRVAARGKNAGSRFWGCANFPRCRGTRAVETVTGTTNTKSIHQLADERRHASRWS